MSQTNILGGERATYVGEETTFGTIPSGSFPNAMVRVMATGEFVVGGLSQEMLDVADERVRRDDNPTKVHGLKIASKLDPLKVHLKAVPTASQLDAGGALGSLTSRILCRHAFGAEHAAVGTTISGTTSTTTLLRVTDATVFKKGTFIAVQVGTEMEWARVDDIDTSATPDEVTISPALSAAPTTAGTIVRNLYNYTRAETNSRTLTVQQAFVGDSTAQHTANGCYGSLTFDIPEVGKLPTMTLGATVSDYALGAQTLSVAAASDEMGAAFAWAPSVYLSTSLARAARLVNEGITIEQVEAVELVRDPGAASTINSVVRTGGRPVACKANVKVRFDSAYDTAFAADTAYRFVVVQKIGTGTTCTFHIWEMPVARIVASPKRVKIGERLHMELMLEGYPDTPTVDDGETGEDLDRVKSALRYAHG